MRAPQPISLSFARAGVARAISSNSTDFWSNFQPALAALVDTGGGADEWARYAAVILSQKDYRVGGQFNIVPRGQD